MYSRCLLLSLPAAPLTFPPHNKRAPLNVLYGVVVSVLESCHLIRSENFAFPQSLRIKYSAIFIISKFQKRNLISLYGSLTICKTLRLSPHGRNRIPCRRGRQHTILSKFPKNCMKSRKFWV